MQTVSLRRPDDWHLHLRSGGMLRAVLPHSAAQFGRAIVMPNLVPPITTAAHAEAYRAEIVAARPTGSDFEPLMTCYLTDTIEPAEVARAYADEVWVAAKLYPAHATTNSAFGVAEIRNIYPVLDRMQAIGMPLLIHGEVTDDKVDVFDREAVFIDRVLRPLLQDFPALRVVLEHVTTEDAVQFVRDHADTGRLGATITAHHLIINRSDIFRGGIRPHMYCLPIAKRERHRLALVEAATSGAGPFFLGTDSAPHPVSAKESDCGCAGIYTAATALELYAEVFDDAGVLDRLEAFASLNGPAFYGLAPNAGRVTLTRAPTLVPTGVETDEGHVVRPFRAGERLRFRFTT